MLFWSLLEPMFWKYEYVVAPSPLNSLRSKSFNPIPSDWLLVLPSTFATTHSISTSEYHSFGTIPYPVTKRSLTPYLAILILWFSNYPRSLFLIILPWSGEAMAPRQMKFVNGHMYSSFDCNRLFSYILTSKHITCLTAIYCYYLIIDHYLYLYIFLGSIY